MFKQVLSIVIATAGMVAAVSAQEGDRVAFPFQRVPAPIANVELVETDGALELVVSGEFPDGCAPDAIVSSEVVGKTLFVDVYREIPFNMECTTVVTPYEARIDASALNETVEGTDGEPRVLVLALNGKLYGVDYPIEGESVQPMLNELLVRGELPITRVMTRHTPEGDMEITLSGELSDACPIPVYRAYEDYQNAGFVIVEAYTAINIAAMCLQAITPFEVVMHAPLFESLAINGVSVPFLPEISVDRQMFVVQQMPVDSATAEWVEGVMPNIKVTVTGTTDGCEDPIQLVQQPTVDNIYYVQVVRVLRDQQPCTMIAREFTQEIYLAPAPEHVQSVQIMINGQPVEFADTSDSE